MTNASQGDVGRVLARAGNPAFNYRSFPAAAEPRPADTPAQPMADPAGTPPPAGSAAGQFSLLGAALPEAAAVTVSAEPPRLPEPAVPGRPSAPVAPPDSAAVSVRPAPAPAPVLVAAPSPGAAPPPADGPTPLRPAAAVETGRFPPRAAPVAAGEERRTTLVEMFRILAGHPAGAMPGRSEAASRTIARFGAR